MRFKQILLGGGLLGMGAIAVALPYSIYHNPVYVIPAYGWVQQYVPREPRDEHDTLWRYRPTEITRITAGKFRGPYALVSGRVRYVVTNPADDDHHVGIEDDNGNVLVTEIVPEFPLPLPSLGETVEIWGMVRQDAEHGWWELHPVIGWKHLEPQ